MSENIEKIDGAESKKPSKAPAPKKDKVKFTTRVRKYGREFKAEFKKIVWPSKKTVARNTLVVLVSIVFIGVVVGLFDWGLTSLLGLIVH